MDSSLQKLITKLEEKASDMSRYSKSKPVRFGRSLNRSQTNSEDVTPKHGHGHLASASKKHESHNHSHGHKTKEDKRSASIHSSNP